MTKADLISLVKLSNNKLKLANQRIADLTSTKQGHDTQTANA